MNWYKKSQESAIDSRNYPGTSDKYEYFSIGQDENSFCWIFDGQKLYWEKGKSHLKSFPEIIQRNKPYWRGWYDAFKKILSVIIPRTNYQIDPPKDPSSLPTKLRVALSDIFGTDNTIMVF